MSYTHNPKDLKEVKTMKARYFTAQVREAAEAMAEAYFRCDKSNITFEIVNEKKVEGDSHCQLFAFFGTPMELANMKAGFGIFYENDGVYLELYQERGRGRPLDSTMLPRHLSRKNISGQDSHAVQSLLAARKGRAKIAPPQQEHIYGEDINIEITKDESEAWATLLEPEQDGAPIDFEEAKQKLASAGVTNGVNEKALKELLEAKAYGRSRIVAEAVRQVDGESGKLIFHFSTDERTGRPREIGGGRVDYRSLDLYIPVSEGQLLVTRVLATEGTPGMTVKGKERKQKPGKEVNMPKGKNVEINDDRTQMRSLCSGMVEYINSTVNVSSVYKIDGDCDLSVGNIDFDGSVHISGSVRSGHTIKATGAVVVGGVVEAATIIAGGNVEIKGGMQGADKGRIEAGGSVNILYIERGTVIAEGSVTVDVCIHSTIEAGGALLAKGKRGAIIGGRVGAASNVVVNTVGSVSHAQTEIEAGMTPKKRARIQILEKEIERVKGDIVKLDQLDAYLEKSKDKLDPQKWDQLFRSGTENRRNHEQLLEDHKEEINELKYELERATEGKVHVFDTAYYGVKIIIGNGLYKVSDEIQYSTFKYKNGEVVYGSCELSKQK